MSPKIRWLLPLIGIALASCDARYAHWKMESPEGRVPTTTTCEGESDCVIVTDYEMDDRSACGDYCYPVVPAHIIVSRSTSFNPPPLIMVWTLPPNSHASFPPDGIKFQNESKILCRLGTPTDAKDQKSFTCKNPLVPSDPNGDGWKYAIKLVLDNHKKLRSYDPWVVNK
jgi:hypothetical protein